jgi:hypothetical protein
MGGHVSGQKAAGEKPMHEAGIVMLRAAPSTFPGFGHLGRGIAVLLNTLLIFLPLVYQSTYKLRYQFCAIYSKTAGKGEC